jgi:hypothetical protein
LVPLLTGCANYRFGVRFSAHSSSPTRFLHVSLAGLLFLAGCSSAKKTDDNAPDAATETTRSGNPELAFDENEDGQASDGRSGQMTAIETSNSPISKFSDLEQGTLTELKSDAADAKVYVASLAPLPKVEGWSAKVVSTDAMWNPDRCSSNRLVQAGKQLVWFDAAAVNQADQATATSGPQYQLVTYNFKKFAALTPIPTTEVALPKSLIAVGDSFGYLWSDGPLASPGDLAIVPATEGGSVSPVPAATGVVQLNFRTVNPDKRTFSDVPLMLPPNSNVVGAEPGPKGTVTLQLSNGFAQFDTSTNELKPLATPPAADEAKALTLPEGACRVG